MAERTITTPKFDSPPVIETALSVEFKPLDRFGIPHFGLFWQRIRSDFPEFSVQAPLGSGVETFDTLPMQAGPQLTMLEAPEVRCWFFDSKTDRLIQVQRDRFVHNWRRSGQQPYPSYESVKPLFEANWQMFCAFLREEGLGEPFVVQCELTYVNHFEIEREWQSMREMPQILTVWSGKFSEGFLPEPEAVQAGVSFLMPDHQGRLRINLQPAIRLTDRKRILQLNLVARGAPQSQDPGGISRWFDLGHEWIVRGFTDITSPEMHKLWKRRQ